MSKLKILLIKFRFGNVRKFGIKIRFAILEIFEGANNVRNKCSDRNSENWDRYSEVRNLKASKIRVLIRNPKKIREPTSDKISFEADILLMAAKFKRFQKWPATS